MFSDCSGWWFRCGLLLIAAGSIFPERGFCQLAELDWVDQFGTDDGDSARAVASDVFGDLFIGGQTRGQIGDVNLLSMDGFVQRRDSEGHVIWTTQLGTSGEDFLDCLAVDATRIAVACRSSIGANNENDVYVATLDKDGNILWETQYGTEELESGSGIALYFPNQVLVAGVTGGDLAGMHQGGQMDAFLTRFDEQGNVVWEQQWGTEENDRLWDVTTDSLGRIYAVGETNGSFNGDKKTGLQSEGFLSRLNSAGNIIWTVQMSDTESAFAVAVNRLDQVYVAGNENGTAFVKKFDAEGNELASTTVQNAPCFVRAMDVNRFGEVVVGGLAFFNFPSDAIVLHFDPALSEDWRFYFGSESQPDWGWGITFDDRDFCIVGQTRQNVLDQPSLGSDDAFAVRFEVPDLVVGDVNSDGVLDLLDILPFVELILSDQYQLEADINLDQEVDLTDVNPFVELLIGG